MRRRFLLTSSYLGIVSNPLTICTTKDAFELRPRKKRLNRLLDTQRKGYVLNSARLCPPTSGTSEWPDLKVRGLDSRMWVQIWAPG